MNRKFSLLKSIVLAVAVLAGASGAAHADDNDMNRFGGDSYRYFHMDHPGGNNGPLSRQRALSENDLQALSSESAVWQAPNSSASTAVASTHLPPASQRTLSEQELQARSSESPVWQGQVTDQPSALATTNANIVAHSNIR